MLGQRLPISWNSGQEKSTSPIEAVSRIGLRPMRSERRDVTSITPIMITMLSELICSAVRAPRSAASFSQVMR